MAAVRELVRIVELLAKIQGELKEPGGTTVNVVYVNAAGLGKSARLTASPTSSEIVDIVAVKPADLAQE